MVDREFSPTRTRSSWKPRVTEQDVPFFRCSSCGTVLAGVSSGSDIELVGTGTTKRVELPYRDMVAPSCATCGQEMARLEVTDVADLPEGFVLDFQFRGGFNANCVKVKWRIPTGSAVRLEWVAIKSFTGMQLKYVTPGKFSPLTFAFADEDAYCYCDSDPCEECMFRCKFGMAAYAYFDGLGLVRMGFDRMLASGAGAGNAGMRRSSN